MALGMSRNIKSEAAAKSEFYLNPTREVLNNTLDRVLTWHILIEVE